MTSQKLFYFLLFFANQVFSQPFPINRTLKVDFSNSSEVYKLMVTTNPLDSVGSSNYARSFPLKNIKTVKRILVSGKYRFFQGSGAFKIIAKTSSGKEFLMLSSKGVSAQFEHKWVKFDSKGFNTQILNNERINKIVIEVNGAEVKVSKIMLCEADKRDKFENYYALKKQIFDSLRIAFSGQMDLPQYTQFWKADITSNLMLSDIDDDINSLDALRGSHLDFGNYCGGVYINVDTIPIPQYDTLPTSLDYRNYKGRNFITSIKRQTIGNCVFQTYCALSESKLMMQRNDTTTLNISERFMQLPAEHDDFIRDYPNSYSEILNKYGLTFDNQWEELNAKKVKKHIACKVDSVLMVPTDNVSLKHALWQYGPIGLSFKESMLNHAMLLVGYGTIKEGDVFNLSAQSMYKQKYIRIEPGCPLIGQTYWIVKNSWGKQWGDNGYCYMLATKNLFKNAYAVKEIKELAETH